MESPGPIIYYSQSMSFFGKKLVHHYNCVEYEPDRDRNKHVFFASLYFGNDYTLLEEHQGSISIFWNGSDVVRLLRSPAWQRLLWGKEDLTHYCHNEQLKRELLYVGIEAQIHPLFFGDASKYQPSFKPSATPHVFMVSHPGRGVEYGVDSVLRIAPKMPEVTFHVFGDESEHRLGNVKFHGHVDEEVMDQRITECQGCLRLNRHDGFSQVVMKSILLAQYPICYQDIPGTMRARVDKEVMDCLRQLKEKTEPNLELREQYLHQFLTLPCTQ